MADKTKNKSKPTTRPCDACAVRRVRCDLATAASGRCTNCVNHDIQCTNVRVRQKSGPKKIQQKTRQNIMSLITSPPAATSAAGSGAPSAHAASMAPGALAPPQHSFSLKQILPYFEIYQKWFYGIWPVMSIPYYVARLKRTANSNSCVDALSMSGADEDFILHIDAKNAQEYALCCALCAMIARYHNFLKSTEEVRTIENCPDAGAYAQEARRIIYEYQLKSTPNIELLLTSFFLHKYHSNTLGEQQRGLIYLRESVSLAHILMLHDPETLLTMSPLDAHRHKKIYYLVLVTERFISFETNLPVLLEPTIPIPDQDFEEYPDLLYGFIALCRIFSATDKQLYVELHTKVLKSERPQSTMLQIPETNILQDFLQNHSNELKKQWLTQLQEKLERKIDSEQIASGAQKVNVMISKAWLQSLGWLIASENFLINPNAQSPPLDDCFSVRFPLKIAQDFINYTKGLPDFAFESNGPDVSVKLLEIADSLYNLIIMTTDAKDTELAYRLLQQIYGMVLRYKSNLDLPQALFIKITGLLNSRRMSHTDIVIEDAMMERAELFDDDNDDDGELNVFEERGTIKREPTSTTTTSFHQIQPSNTRSSSSSIILSDTQRADSVSSVDDIDPKMQTTTLPPLPAIPSHPSGTNLFSSQFLMTAMSPTTSFSPSGFTPGLFHSGLTPNAGGMGLQKSPSAAMLSQMGASLSPFYIPGTMS